MSVQLIPSPASTVSPPISHYHPYGSLTGLLMISIGLLWLKNGEQEANWCLCYISVATPLQLISSPPSTVSPSIIHFHPSVTLTCLLMLSIGLVWQRIVEHKANCWFCRHNSVVNDSAANSIANLHCESQDHSFSWICITNVLVDALNRSCWAEKCWTRSKWVILPW